MASELTWDARFLEAANLVASWSKDRSTQVGAVIVRNKTIIATGWNGFPRGVDETIEARHERPVKYAWSEHAEGNAIFNAAKTGVSTQDATMYVMWHPCADCARAIIQSGISELVTPPADLSIERWRDSFVIAWEMLTESRVITRYY